VEKFTPVRAILLRSPGGEAGCAGFLNPFVILCADTAVCGPKASGKTLDFLEAEALPLVNSPQFGVGQLEAGQFEAGLKRP
jgi:hypothetical protein